MRLVIHSNNNNNMKTTFAYNSHLMMASAVLWVLFVSLLATAQQVRHLELNGAHLIDTSQYNYGLGSPKLEAAGWKCISVNGDTAVAYSATCQVRRSPYKELSGDERKLISDTKNQINMIASRGGNFRGRRNGKRMSYSSARFSLFGGGVGGASSSQAVSTSNNNNNGIESYSIGRPGMGNNLARLFVDGDLVTFVYLDGQVAMKPRNCLDPSEQQQLDQSKVDLAQFKENMKQMQQKMESNMQMMQQNMMNLQQSMQNSMNSIYGGFGYVPPVNPAAAFAGFTPTAFTYPQYSPYGAMSTSAFVPPAGAGLGAGTGYNPYTSATTANFGPAGYPYGAAGFGSFF